MEVDATSAQERTPPALQALLYRIVDYAGIFPPAALSLTEAIQNYARYRKGRQEWMLSRFVIPASRLDELDAFSGLYRDDPPFLLSALGSGGDTAEEFVDAFQSHIDSIQNLHERHNDRIHADVMEVRIPQNLLDAEKAELETFFDEVYRAVVMTGLSKLNIFFEVPSDAHLSRRLPEILPAMNDFNKKQHTPLRSELGYKIRCGGKGPDAVPKPKHVAQVIEACHLNEVQFKATAGLHHPLHHYDQESERDMHGFFNVFGAAALLRANKIAPNELLDVLTDGNQDHFRFDKDTFYWKSHEVPVGEVIDTRESFAISFGSCSFDEPREDLEDMGLL